MAKDHWKRFNLYERGIGILLMINIVFVIFNQEIKEPIIPIEIAGYFFWLNSGLFLGFKLSFSELKQMWNEANKQNSEG